MGHPAELDKKNIHVWFVFIQIKLIGWIRLQIIGHGHLIVQPHATLLILILISPYHKPQVWCVGSACF